MENELLEAALEAKKPLRYDGVWVWGGSKRNGKKNSWESLRLAWFSWGMPLFTFFFFSGNCYFFFFVEFFFLNNSMELGGTWLYCLKKFKICIKLRTTIGPIKWKFWKVGGYDKDSKGSGFMWGKRKLLTLMEMSGF